MCELIPLIFQELDVSPGEHISSFRTQLLSTAFSFPQKTHFLFRGVLVVLCGKHYMTHGMEGHSNRQGLERSLEPLVGFTTWDQSTVPKLENLARF